VIRPVVWKARHELIPAESIQRIHAASLHILEHIGLRMPLEARHLDQARDLGLQWDPTERRILFPPDRVEAALDRAPRQYTLCARNPANDVLLDGRHGYLGLDGCGIQVLDMVTGRPRPSTKADLQDAVHMADALEQIAFLWPAVTAGDCPAETQPLHELEALLTHSSKHVQAMTAVDAGAAQGSIEIARAVAGGEQALRARPIISNFQCSVSPLSYDENALQALFLFAEAGIPTGFVAMPIGCATAPASVAGIAAQANAELLAGITVLELFFPGTPTFYGACPTMMDLRTGGITSGGPEDFLLQAAACQLAHSYGLPAHIGTFATGAPVAGWHAAADNALSGAMSALTAADLLCGAGLLGSARVFSFEQLLLDCELFDRLRATVEGFADDADHLALDSIGASVAQGDFLTSAHTLKYMEEVWQPSFLESASWEAWIGGGRQGAREKAHRLASEFLSGLPYERSRTSRRRARDRAVELRAAHPAEPLPQADAIGEIIAEHQRKAEKTHGR
jgi:trimethylamine--corrinoid protein Co-methyltransferase